MSDESKQANLSTAERLAMQYPRVSADILRQHGAVQNGNVWTFPDGSTGELTHGHAGLQPIRNDRGETLFPKQNPKPPAE